MTHPLTAALAAMIREEFSGYRYMDPDTPERIAADWLDRILRHPAMRKPSEAVVDAAFNAQPIPSMRAPKGWMTTAWRAGLDGRRDALPARGGAARRSLHAGGHQ